MCAHRVLQESMCANRVLQGSTCANRVQPGSRWAHRVQPGSMCANRVQQRASARVLVPTSTCMHNHRVHAQGMIRQLDTAAAAVPASRAGKRPPPPPSVNLHSLAATSRHTKGSRSGGRSGPDQASGGAQRASWSRAGSASGPSPPLAPATPATGAGQARAGGGLGLSLDAFAPFLQPPLGDATPTPRSPQQASHPFGAPPPRGGPSWRPGVHTAEVRTHTVIQGPLQVSVIQVSVIQVSVIQGPLQVSVIQVSVIQGPL